MRTKFIFLIVLSVISFVCGCKKEEQNPVTNNANNNTGNTGNETPGDVYICGTEQIGSDEYPRYWKNGEQFEIYSANRPATATCIWVNDQHVFVGGRINEIGSVQNQPCYWVDDELFELNNDDGSVHCSIKDIYVKGENEVFTAGHIRDESGWNKAMYWNASIAVELTDGSKDAEAHGIWVDGNDVYVCGYEKDQAFGGSTVAKYWVNGVPVTLGSGEEDSFAYDIRVVNGDVIVVGTDADMVGTQNGEQAVIWINGVRSEFTGSGGAAYSVFADGDDIYVGGEVWAGSETLPTYWLNFNGFNPYTPDGLIAYGAVSEIFVYDGVIHTLGALYTDNSAETYADYGNMYGLFVY
jgi:hypothetical protein